MFRLEKEQEIKSLQAELDSSSSGEASDPEKKSDSGSVDQDDKEKLNFDAEQNQTNEFAESLKVSFPEQRTSLAAIVRSSCSKVLNATRLQISRRGIFEKRFEHETRIVSTPLATKRSRSAPLTH